jgi:hypothetical protein
LATDRDPSQQEFTILDNLYKKQLAHYEADRKAAAKVISVGESKADAKIPPPELAAWTLVTSTILNMNETITRN